VEGPDCGDVPLQALEVVTPLSKVVFHGFSAEIQESWGKGGIAAHVNSPDAILSQEDAPIRTEGHLFM
jgi:hypothetical protein